MNRRRILTQNNEALAAALNFQKQNLTPTVHNTDFHEARREYPYFGYIDVLVDDVGFVMYSNNDDIVAQSYFWYGPNGYEPFSVRLFKEMARNSTYIFDIGSFTGLFSLSAAVANPKAKVTAYEPSRSTWERAKINFVVNRLGTKIDLRNVAMSNKAEQITLKHFRGHLTLQSGASFLEKEGKEIYSVEVINTVIGDNEVAEIGGMDLAKIDVEGAELSVLKGLEKTIKTKRPKILIEVEPLNYKSVKSFFKKHDYKFLFVDDDNLKILETNVGSKKVLNYLALPSETDVPSL